MTDAPVERLLGRAEFARRAKGHGQSLVEREVALAAVEEGEPGLGMGRDTRVPPHRRTQRSLDARRCVERRDAAVEAVVVEERGAGSEDPAGALGSLSPSKGARSLSPSKGAPLRRDRGPELVRHEVEVGAPARGDDGGAVDERANGVGELEEIGEVVAHRAERNRRTVVPEGALVAGHPGEAQHRRRGDGAGDLDGRLESARAGATARGAEVDEHVDRSGRPDVGERALHGGDRLGGVRPARERERRVGEFTGDEAQRGGRDQRIREHDRLDSERASGAHLARASRA